MPTPWQTGGYTVYDVEQQNSKTRELTICDVAQVQGFLDRQFCLLKAAHSHGRSAIGIGRARPVVGLVGSDSFMVCLLTPAVSRTEKRLVVLKSPSAFPRSTRFSPNRTPWETSHPPPSTRCALQFVPPWKSYPSLGPRIPWETL